ncbi:hypothetical protein ACVIHI_009058 [Bradyrhizobium sp. USDA 4524]|nr:hypothetical protein [Bradyrhizobium sp. USDA 4538]MCP1907203.1 hypothetical protein [Bradyrhizobium sp. USDA 4537]MCP1985679.1 hypothetical protein [Bradyrhizobium sp. USDA 4539]
MVQITMSEEDGKMMFTPTTIDVKSKGNRSHSFCPTMVDWTTNSFSLQQRRTSGTPRP